MAGSLGKASLVLGTTWSKLSTGLDGAFGQIRAWKGKVGGLLGSGGAAAGGTGGAALGGLAGLAGKFGPVGAAIAAATAGAVSFGKALGTIEETARMGEIARAFNLSAEAASGMFGVMEAAGSPIKESMESITQFSGKITDAISGKGAEAQELFSLIKRDAKDFAKLDASEGFYALHQAISEVNNPLDKMRALSLAFGTDGMKLLLPLLNKSTAQLKEQAAGLAVSSSQMEKFSAAQRAIGRAGTAAGQLWRAAVAAVAPIIEFAADRLAGLARAIAPAFEWAGRGVEAFATVAGAVFSEVIALALEGWETISGWAAELGVFAGEWPTIQEVVLMACRAVALALASVWDVLKAGAGAAAYVTSYIVDGFAHLVDAFKGTVKDLLELGAAAREGMGLDGGWFRRQADQVDTLGARVHAAADSMREWGKGTFANFGKSIDSVNAWFDKLAQQKVDGPTVAPKVDTDGASRAGRALAAALERGTKEEYSVRVKHQMGDVASVAQQQLAAERQAVGILGQILASAQGILGRVSGGMIPAGLFDPPRPAGAGTAGEKPAPAPAMPAAEVDRLTAAFRARDAADRPRTEVPKLPTAAEVAARLRPDAVYLSDGGKRAAAEQAKSNALLAVIAERLRRLDPPASPPPVVLRPI